MWVGTCIVSEEVGAGIVSGVVVICCRTTPVLRWSWSWYGVESEAVVAPPQRFVGCLFLSLFVERWLI